MSPVVHSYEALVVLSKKILEAVRAGDWDACAEHQKAYGAETERLRQFDYTAQISEDERLRRLELLEDILGFDTRIRELVASHLEELVVAQ